jgi:5'(3')-deoxyribonucleotidase
LGPKRLIGVDVDITLVSSELGWLDWLNSQDSAYTCDLEGWKLIKNGVLPYNLGALYPDLEDTLQYWRELDYSQFQPHAGSVEALKELSEYFGIVFISSVKGNHNKSKYYWLKEHFPFMEGYIATKEKYLMANSLVAMIDDRNEQLAGFNMLQRVLFESHYDQNVECFSPFKIKSWEDFSVKKFCRKYL